MFFHHIGNIKGGDYALAFLISTEQWIILWTFGFVTYLSLYKNLGWILNLKIMKKLITFYVTIASSSIYLQYSIWTKSIFTLWKEPYVTTIFDLTDLFYPNNFYYPNYWLFNYWLFLKRKDTYCTHCIKYIWQPFIEKDFFFFFQSTKTQNTEITVVFSVHSLKNKPNNLKWSKDNLFGMHIDLYCNSHRLALWFKLDTFCIIASFIVLP